MQLSQREMKMTTIDMEGVRELTDAELESVVGGQLTLAGVVQAAKDGAHTGSAIGSVGGSAGSAIGGVVGGVIGAIGGVISGLFG
jgi:hypothetical protein